MRVASQPEIDLLHALDADRDAFGDNSLGLPAVLGKEVINNMFTVEKTCARGHNETGFRGLSR